jgi:hypothetical protein
MMTDDDWAVIDDDWAVIDDDWAVIDGFRTFGAGTVWASTHASAVLRRC